MSNKKISSSKAKTNLSLHFRLIIMKLVEYIVILIALIFIVVIIVPHVQHSGLRGLYNPEIKELKLIEWDYLTDDEVCFSYFYPEEKEATIFINEEERLRTDNRSVCLRVLNDSRITINVDNKTVSFNVEKETLDCTRDVENYVNLELPTTLEQYKKYELNITLFNGKCRGRVYRLRLYLDGKLEKEIPVKVGPFESKTIREDIRFTKEGNHNIKIEFGNEAIERELIVIPSRLDWKFPIGVFLFIALLIIYLHERNKIEGLAKLFSITLSFLVIIPLIFQLFDLKFFIPTFVVGFGLVMICAMKSKYF